MLSYFFDISRRRKLIMAYRTGNREQMMLLPQSIEDYVGQGDPVRAFDAFVEVLDFNKCGIIIDSRKVGNPGYNQGDVKAFAVWLFIWV
jgi:hypothetical protein